MTQPPDPQAFFNREVSWLAFDQRVLEEAADPSNPLLERVKFAAITASNLDEFFMVRVAGLKHAIDEDDETRDPSGLTPMQQLTEVARRTAALVKDLYALVLDELLPALAQAQVEIIRWNDLPAPRQLALRKYFREGVFPVLTPLAINSSRPFPLLSSLSLNLAVRLDGEIGPDGHRLAIVQVPQGLQRLVRIDQGPGVAFVLLEDIIRANAQELFPGQTILDVSVIRLSRDAEMEFDDEGGRTQLEVIERELRRRKRGGVVRLEVDANAPEELIKTLERRLDAEPEDVYRVPGPLDLRFLMGVTDVPGLDALRDQPWRPVDTLATEGQADVFSVLDERDLLLHHPYEAYDPVVAMIAQAADDPDVLAIKQTLYRTSVGSPIVASLLRAAEQNKQVTVLVELAARFDEERNIHWARALEEAGAHVIYGIQGYKTHAKICLIVRRTPHGLKRYVHVATGNYNERTSRLYTDFGLLTTSQAIAEDATAFFGALTGYSDPPKLKKLVMAPTRLRERLHKLIDRERRHAEAGRPAEIIAKMNSLVDEDIVRALYAASKSGVRIRLNIRGICVLKPGVPGLSDKIEVVSVVDRFLEHSRIFYFLNDGDEDVFLASADWMNRNLDKRVELMFPVEEPAHKAKVLYTLRAMFMDNVKARWLGADGVYKKRPVPRGEKPFRVQRHLHEEMTRLNSIARDKAGVTLRPKEREGAGLY